LTNLKLSVSFKSRRTVIRTIILLGLTMPFYGEGIDDFAGGYLLESKSLEILLHDNIEVELAIPKDLYVKIENCAKSRGLSVDDFLSSVLRPPS
jgi:hypothetical protein